jgi:hypothetical protein
VSGARPVGDAVPPRDTSGLFHQAFRALASAGHAAVDAPGPEEALLEITRVCPTVLGDPDAHERPGALKPGERQFSVCGVFLLTADRRHNVLVAEVGFPPDQHRLRIDVELGHPGFMVKHQRPLLLANTDLDTEFRQILKTARMGSVVFAPMRFKREFLGSLVLASQARHTYGEDDLEALVAFTGLASAVFCAHDGPAWFRTLG